MGMPAPQLETIGAHNVTILELVTVLTIIDNLVVEAIPQFIDLASDAKNGTLPLPLPLPLGGSAHNLGADLPLQYSIVEHSFVNTVGLSADHGLVHGLG